MNMCQSIIEVRDTALADKLVEGPSLSQNQQPKNFTSSYMLSMEVAFTIIKLGDGRLKLWMISLEIIGFKD